MNPASYNGLIFDLDGVLCFTDQYHYLAWKQLTDQEGIPFDHSVNDRLRGVSRMQSLEIILERSEKPYTQAEKEAMTERKNGYYQVFLAQMSPKDLAPDTVEVLETLRQRGYRLALGSSSRNARQILKQTGLEPLFDAISDGNGLRNSKPDPEVFLWAAELLDLPTDRCLVIEDAQAGIEAACRGGFDSAALGDAHLHPKATYRLTKLADLLQFCL